MPLSFTVIYKNELIYVRKTCYYLIEVNNYLRNPISTHRQHTIRHSPNINISTAINIPSTTSLVIPISYSLQIYISS